jgi:type I restriction enzyme S subunit
MTSTIADLLQRGSSLKTGPFGSTLAASEYTEVGVPVVSVGEVGDGRLEVGRQTRRVDAGVTLRLAEYVLEEDDIVFARKGSVGRTARVKRNEAGWFLGSDGLRLRVGTSADAAFIAFQLRSAEVRDWLIRHAGGSTLLSLNQETIARIPLHLPPLPTQRAIAEVLGALDDKIAANQAVSTAADALACAEFEASRRSSTLNARTFDDVAGVAGGGTPSTKVAEFWDGDIAWVTPTDVTALSAPYLDSTARRITDAGLAMCSSAVYPVDCILMTSRATIGAFALAKVPTAVNQGFIVAQARDPRAQFWLFHEMRSRVDDFMAHANGATFLELSKSRFKAMQVMWPGEPGVFQEFARRVTPLHDRAYAATVESRHLATLRDTLLPHLMSGRITVRDAEKAVEEVL